MNKTRPLSALRMLVGFLVLGLSPTASFAETKEGSVQQKRTITDAKGKKVTVIDFNDSVIEGKAKAPDGFVLQSRQGGSFRSILSLRKNFRPQIASSATEAQVRSVKED